MTDLVGQPFGLRERFRLGGIGSPKLWITESSPEIRGLLELDTNSDTCNIELRPSGIVLRFRSLLETHALVIPFRQLSLFLSRNVYTVHGAAHFIRVRAGDPEVEAFFRKLQQQKALCAMDRGPFLAT